MKKPGDIIRSRGFHQDAAGVRPDRAPRRAWSAATAQDADETLSCAEADQVCCEVPEDSEDPDTEETPEDSETSDNVCTFNCVGSSYCSENDGVEYPDMTCTGSRVCCDVEMDTLHQ